MARVTRSQSRELETLGPQNGRVKSATQKKAIADRLPMVAESPQTPGRKAPAPTTSVLESPGNQEGHSALSGTTVHHVSESEDESDVLDMVDELPDLQQAAGSLLDLLISSNSDPISIFNAAKRTRDTDAKRVKRHSKKLLERMKVYGQQTFIDVPQSKRQIPSVEPKDGSRPWSPSPTLHLSNCARLVLDILLENVGSQPTLRAIRSLETQFPAPFMDQITDGTRSMSVGTSATEKSTFELALEIRTQFFIMELERCQTEPDFDPKSILMKVFYTQDVHDVVDPGLLRGFNLAGAFEDENGCLPYRFQDTVAERIRELEVEIFDDDDALNIKGLRAAFSWKRFVLRTANFIYQREREIRHDLQTQPSFDEVKGSIIQEIKRRDDPNWIDPADWRDSVAPSSVQRSSRPPLGPSSQTPSRQQSMARTPDPELPGQETPAKSRAGATPPKSIDQDSHAMPPPRNPGSNVSPQRPVQGSEGASMQRPMASTPERPTESTAMSRASHVRNSSEQGSTVTSPSRPSAKNPRRRKSRNPYMNPESIAALTGRQAPFREQNPTRLGPQDKEHGPAAPYNPTITSPSSAQRGRDTRDEIPQTQDTAHVALELDNETDLPGQEVPITLSGVDDPASSIQSPRNDSKRQTSRPWFGHRQPVPEAQQTAQNASQDTDRNHSSKAQADEPRHRTLYDRQSDARRISPISDSQTPDSERHSRSVEKPRGKKRTREDTLVIDESEDEFQTMSGDTTDIARRRAQKPHQERRVRPRVEIRAQSDNTAESAENQLFSSLNETTIDEPATRDQHEVHSTPSASNRKISSTQPSPSRPAPPSSQINWPRPNTPDRTGEVRRGRGWWTQERTDRLVQLIGKHGPKWADIISEDRICPEELGGAIFGPADGKETKLQTVLKDRARVLKRKWRNEKRALPENFQYVTG